MVLIEINQKALHVAGMCFKQPFVPALPHIPGAFGLIMRNEWHDVRRGQRIICHDDIVRHPHYIEDKGGQDAGAVFANPTVEKGRRLCLEQGRKDVRKLTVCRI